MKNLLKILLFSLVSISWAHQDFYQIEVKSITGQTYSLSDYKGKVVLIANTASQCGYTPQYKSLQAIYDKYKTQGLVVLGMPSNQFGGQEPGTEKQIKSFCEFHFGVNFPLLKKGDVKGPHQHPLYHYLLSASPTHEEVSWNFEKFLIGRDGKIKARFKSSESPLDSIITTAIEAALNAH